MASKILRPGAIGNYDAWTLAAGATKVAAVDSGDPVSHDDATTRLQAVTNPTALRQSFTISAGSVPSNIGFVASVSTAMRVLQEDPGDGVKGFRSFVRLASTDSFSGSFTVGAFNTYETTGPSVITRPGGGSWTPVDISTALEIGIEATGGGAATSNIATTLWGVLEYEVSSVGIMGLVSGVLLPVLGAGLDMLHMARIGAWLQQRLDLALRPDELVLLLAELKAPSRRYA